ncbi:uncharacterized protein LOC143422683 [Xylocopa sonorina]|uniref:uncharacterized protein LOC143422683 n=1 Tax=Xylocopa sonorina TaxID=1818115 RepID=UPI00403B0039
MFAINTNKTILIKSLQHFTLLCMKINLATKNKTLYETLGVAQNATYNEIKSAYYALTLKYHPDRNKSESAKVMFQEISNAYDVLSKYQTRMQYDRTLKIKHHDLHKHSQEQMKRRHPKNTVKYDQSMKNIYDFDAWLEEHYSYVFKKNLKRKADQEIFEKEQVTQNALPSFFVISIIIAVLVYCGYMYRTAKEKLEPSLKLKSSKEYTGQKCQTYLANKSIFCYLMLKMHNYTFISGYLSKYLMFLP